MKRSLLLLASVMLLIIVFTACSGDFLFGGFNKKSSEDQGVIIDPDPLPEQKTLTLYFKHDTSDYLVPEKREVEQTSQSLEQLVIEQLLKGPRGFNRVSIMPDNLKLLDVTRKGDIVFVNFSKEFMNNINLATYSDKANIPEDEKPKMLEVMKRLSIYSIVNSLTELHGVNQVKILIENRPPTYQELGAELLMTGLANITADSSMVAITRNKYFILSPAVAVEQVLKGLVGEPNWNKVYNLLDEITIKENNFSTVDEFKKFILAQGVSLEVDENPIDDQEVKPDGEAFVTAHYTIKYPNGKKDKRDRELITVINREGIWKVMLPESITKPGL